MLEAMLYVRGNALCERQCFMLEAMLYVRGNALFERQCW